MRRTFSVISLGCFRNSYDSEIVITDFLNRGYSFMPPESLSLGKRSKAKAVDLLLVNTCGFIDKAKEESLRAISSAVDLKKRNIVGKVVVLGCLVKRYRRQLEKAYSSVDSWRSVVEFSRSFVRRKKFLSPPSVGFLKICEGCLNQCSFCAIPLIKGSLRSKPKAEVIKEAVDLEKRGVRELNIIGQDITSWGKDFKTKSDLAGLLKGILSAAKKIRWIRLVYTHPRHFNDSLIEVIAGNERVCKYIDLPIQHINDRILKLMNRGITGKKTRKLIEKIRKRIPGCVIRSSVIVGFPTESESEFRELMDFIQEARFDRLGAFEYSAEEGTRACKFNPKVHHSTKRRRFRAVMEEQKKIANRVNRRFLGKELEVLIESEDSGLFIGRTGYDAPDVDGAVFIKPAQAKPKAKGRTKIDRLKPGCFYRAKIIDCLDYDLVAE